MESGWWSGNSDQQRRIAGATAKGMDGFKQDRYGLWGEKMKVREEKAQRKRGWR